MGTLVITLSLPYPPSVNGYWRAARGRIYMTRRGKEYRKAVAAELDKHDLAAINADVAISLDMYPPDKRVRDVDNIQKPLLDALQSCGLLVNDSQVCLLVTARRKPRKGGRVIATIFKRGECMALNADWWELN